MRLCGFLICLLCGLSGCAERVAMHPIYPTGQLERFKYTKGIIKGLTPSGEIELTDGRSFRLAGIKMRPVDETQEPQALTQIVKDIRKSSPWVEIELHEATGSATAFYRQRYRMRDDYTGMINLFCRFYTPERLNELFIAAGVAHYDPQNGVVTRETQKHLVETEVRYKDAIARVADWAQNNRYTPLELNKRYAESGNRAGNWNVEYVWQGDRGYFNCHVVKGDLGLVLDEMKSSNDSAQ